MIVAPSLLSADFNQLIRDLDIINNSDADWFHIDIMDGVFVPNISFGFPVLESIKKNIKKPLDVHLMITEPTKFITQLKDLGTNLMSVHYETCVHLHRTIQQIKECDMKVGVALNPHTPISLLEDVICDIDVVLIMSVNPGFGGQKFISSSINKIERLKEMILRKKASALIEVDGGVNHETSVLLKQAGADILVAGNYVFKSSDPQKIIHYLKSL